MKLFVRTMFIVYQTLQNENKKKVAIEQTYYLYNSLKKHGHNFRQKVFFPIFMLTMCQ